MLSKDLKRLHGLFCQWTDGRAVPDTETWHEFKRTLHNAAIQATMLELGVDLSIIDVLAEVAKPASNVALFPRERMVRRLPITIDGEAS